MEMDEATFKHAIDALDNAVQMLRAAAPPARPEPRYHEGDTFVLAGVDTFYRVIVEKPVWLEQARVWAYRYRGSDGVAHGSWPAEQEVDAGRYKPCPPRPAGPEARAWKAPVECREFDPEKVAGWFARSAGTGEVCTHIPEEPIKRLDWGLRVWIAARKAPAPLTGVEWLDVLKTGEVFDFLGEWYAVRQIEPPRLCIVPLTVYRVSAVRHENGDWMDTAPCFAGHAAELSDATVTILLPAGKEE